MDIIEKQKLQAKWEANNLRRLEAQKAIDFYNYVQKEYLEDEIDDKYKRKENAEALKRVAYTYPPQMRL